jgi:hypothetical protein
MFNIDAEDQAALREQANYLSQYPNIRATIEGHCDERGTREYNIALGERRANAAKNYLISLGVAADRLSVVSFGKERAGGARLRRTVLGPQPARGDGGDELRVSSPPARGRGRGWASQPPTHWPTPASSRKREEDKEVSRAARAATRSRPQTPAPRLRAPDARRGRCRARARRPGANSASADIANTEKAEATASCLDIVNLDSCYPRQIGISAHIAMQHRPVA